MAIIKYPDWLPLAQRASKNLTQQTPFRSDQPAVGAPIFQKLTTDVAVTWSVTWVFSLEQERAFMQWLRSSKYLNHCNNWFTMMIDLGGSGLQEQTLHFTDYPVQTSIDGGVVTWTGNVIAKKLNNTMDEFDDVLVELDYRWYSWLDEVVNRELPQVYMTPILHMPINMLSSTLDSRIIYDGPQIYYINRNGNLVQSAAGEWPLTFIDGVAVGRVPPEVGGLNLLKMSEDLSDPVWAKTRTTVTYGGTQDPTGGTGASKLVPTTTTGNHSVLQLITPEPSTAYTYSVFVKANGYNNALVQIGVFASQVASNPVYVDLSTGVITSANDYSRCGIIAVGDGWFRVWVRVITNSSPTSINASVWASDAANNTSFPGDGVSAISVFGAQMEKSTNLSSYIKTEENLITRPTASAKVVMSGATSIDITYSDDSVVNVPSVDGYASIPQADSAWGSKYITTIKFNV